MEDNQQQKGGALAAAGICWTKGREGGEEERNMHNTGRGEEVEKAAPKPTNQPLHV